MGIRGVEVETVLTAAVYNNSENIKKKGKDWCKVVLDGVISKHGQLRSVHLNLITALLSCNGQAVKEVQDFVRSQIQANSSLEALLVPGNMADLTDLSEIDASANAESIEIEANSLLLLARVCEGKNAASNVFAERFVSLEWLLSSLLQVPESWHVLDVGCRYKRALLTCLNEIYLHADFTCIQHQVKVLETGFWTLAGDDFVDLQHCQPLILNLQLELHCLCSLLQAFCRTRLVFSFGGMAVDAEGEAEKPRTQQRRLTCEYLCYINCILVLLRDYYLLPTFEMPERARHYRITQELRHDMEALDSLIQVASMYIRIITMCIHAPPRTNICMHANMKYIDSYNLCAHTYNIHTYNTHITHEHMEYAACHAGSTAAAGDALVADCEHQHNTHHHW